MPSSPQYVQTVPRRGYRFVARCRPHRRGGRHCPAMRDPVSRLDHRVIAVSDFRNVTARPHDDWMAAGIAETVTNDLRALRDLRVIDRASVPAAGAPRVDRRGAGQRTRSARRRQLPAARRSAADHGARDRCCQRRGDGAARRRTGRSPTCFDCRMRSSRSCCASCTCPCPPPRRRGLARTRRRASKPTGRSLKAGSSSRRSTQRSFPAAIPTSSARSRWTHGMPMPTWAGARAPLAVRGVPGTQPAGHRAS